MPDLAGALDAALRARYPRAGVKTPATQRRGLVARMNQLEEQFSRKGDRKGAANTRAANAAGISARTWQKWHAGSVTPSARMLAKLEAAYDKIIVEPKFRRKVNSTPPPARVHVSAEIWWNGYRNKTLYRTVRLAGLSNVMRHVIRAWARESPEAAAEVFERGVADVESVPSEPGIQFAGENVVIDFPGE